MGTLFDFFLFLEDVAFFLLQGKPTWSFLSRYFSLCSNAPPWSAVPAHPTERNHGSQKHALPFFCFVYSKLRPLAGIVLSIGLFVYCSLPTTGRQELALEP
jgi:hypothetical protein